MTRTYLVGDVHARLADIADGSVDLFATSPPFIALRAYLPDDHPCKHLEIGSEPDPATFLDVLLGVTAQWGEKLAPHGSIAVELGDTYAGSSGAGGPVGAPGERLADRETSRRRPQRKAKGHDGEQLAAPPDRMRTRRQLPGWPRAKSLALIPQAYALSLAYGRNVLNGNPSPAGEWLVRNVIVWHRPNPAVGALGDKVRPSTSYITVATRADDRWYDLTAVRGDPSPNTHARTAKGVEVKPTTGKTADKDGNFDTLATMHMTGGSPPLDTWFDEYDSTHRTWIHSPAGSQLAHYAMWPAKLADRLVQMMCPLEVCTTCGKPRRRLTRRTNATGVGFVRNQQPGNERKTLSTAAPDYAEIETLGWSDCGHGTYRPGMVVDPFAGTGTTLCVADLRGRDSIGIDLDERNELLMPARFDECKQALFGTRPEMAGQLGLFGS